MEAGETSTHGLRETARPDFESGDDPYRLVDLFAGCGGLSLGVAQAVHEVGRALEIPLAVDVEASAAAVYAANFPKAGCRTEKVEQFFNGKLGAPITTKEALSVEVVGEAALLVGGPPCQGHSDLNNHTRRDDPKNALYERMARAAEVLDPAAVLIENVPAVRHDKTAVVGRTKQHLKGLGYRVADRVVSLDRLGVAQRRKRHILLAVKDGDPVQYFADLEADKQLRTLEWAIGDLRDLVGGTGLDQAPRASRINLARMEWLLKNDKFDLPNKLRPPCHQDEAHSYKSMYGRLRWDQPAQTITSGFGSIGQGRFMHPSQARALTPHEAARLQGFPDYFDFGPAAKRRADLATIIGNAVPPALTYEIVRRLLAAEG